MNLQIALRRRTSAGVAVMSALALSSGTTLLLQPQEAQAGQQKAVMAAGDCFFFANRWWCP